MLYKMKNKTIIIARPIPPHLKKAAMNFVVAPVLINPASANIKAEAIVNKTKSISLGRSNTNL